MNSPHEGHSVIREELDVELWEHVCHDTGRSPEARREAMQVAAMALRYIIDLCEPVPEPPSANRPLTDDGLADQPVVEPEP